MQEINSLIKRIKSVQPEQFEQLALDVFQHQYHHNEVYAKWCNSLGLKVQSFQEIPFLPIEFFKKHEIRSGKWKANKVFESSGTTGIDTSKHLVFDENFYLENCVDIFESKYGPLGNFETLALLPSYLERENSGLISMVAHFIKQSNSTNSGFYLNNLSDLYDKLRELRLSNKPVILWGVTFALLDFAELYSIDFPELIIMETGGMKGRREEMVRGEVHAKLQQSFGVERIHSEYGMTELFSQAYSHGSGIFEPSRTMKVIGRDLNDPLSFPSKNKTVAFNLVDLANIFTCSFIETKDLGTIYPDGKFEVKGRMDNSDLRGCNLLVL